MLLEDLGELEEDLLALRLELGFAGIEKDPVEDVDGQLALEFGDGDVARLQFRPHLGFEGGTVGGSLLDLLFELSGLGTEVFELCRERAVGAAVGLGQGGGGGGCREGGIATVGGFPDLQEANGPQEEGGEDSGEDPDLLLHMVDSNRHRE